jgi:hypothetical protein
MQRYNRQRDIPRLFSVWRDELGDDLISRTKLVAKLERACRSERQRGLAEHWAYDVARHTAMVAVLEEEQTSLAAMWQRDHAL